jgi:hypothetical protein
MGRHFSEIRNFEARCDLGTLPNMLDLRFGRDVPERPELAARPKPRDKGRRRNMNFDTATPVAIPWGLLGPDELPNERRSRTLELGAAVRHYNDLAVPGLGGVWFGRQLLWPTLGVIVADALRQQGQRHGNIEVANAIEALACWLALKNSSTQRDPRLRGVTKLRVDQPSSYKRLSRTSAYVSQPMRMSAVQPLRALGLLSGDSDRFNAFAPSNAGTAFVDAACAEFEPVWNRQSTKTFLQSWVSGNIEDANKDRLHEVLSPLKPLPPVAVSVLKDRLISGPVEPASRRRAALAWVTQVQQTSNVASRDDARPSMLSQWHWNDLRLGAAFFAARDRALEVLDCVEREIGLERIPLKLDASLPKPITDALNLASEAATKFLQMVEQEPKHQDAVSFCKELVNLNGTDRLQSLVIRDGRVMQLRDRAVVPGAAFEGKPAGVTEDRENQDDTPNESGLHFPANISYRIHNLYRLHLDMEGLLDDWLHPKAKA